MVSEPTPNLDAYKFTDLIFEFAFMIAIIASPTTAQGILAGVHQGIRDRLQVGRQMVGPGSLEVLLLEEIHQLVHGQQSFKVWIKENLRGPPRPGKPPGGPGNGGGAAPKPPGGGGKAPNPGPGPPTPVTGPESPIGMPRPAGRAIPGPEARAAAVEVPPGAEFMRAAGSAGGGPSTETDTTMAPRMMVRPIARRSSVSVNC
jgi:hypothetical protein